MSVVTSIMKSVVAPLKRAAHSPNLNLHRRFYKQGLMTQEIEALESIFRKNDFPPPNSVRKAVVHEDIIG